MTKGKIFTRWSCRKHQGLSGPGASTLPWGLIKNLGVKRSSAVPERQLRHKGRAPSRYRTKKVGKKRRATKEWLQNHSMFIRKDEIPRAGTNQQLKGPQPSPLAWELLSQILQN